MQKHADTNRFLISLINLGFFGIRKNATGKVAVLGVTFSFKNTDKKLKTF